MTTPFTGLSPERLSAQSPHKAGRRLRIIRRLSLFGLILLTLGTIVFLIGRRILPTTGVFEPIYRLHDAIYLTLKGHLWTRIMPEGFWVWFVIGALTLILVTSWLTDRSLIVGWHHRLLRFILPNPVFSPLLLRTAKWLPAPLFPYRLAVEISYSLWLEALIEVCAKTTVGATKPKVMNGVLGRWETMVQLNVYRPWADPKIIDEWAAHHLMLINVLCGPDALPRHLKMLKHIRTDVNKLSDSTKPSDSLKIWWTVQRLIYALKESEGNIQASDVRNALAESELRLRRQIQMLDQLGHHLQRSLSVERVDNVNRNLRVPVLGGINTDFLSHHDFRVWLDFSVWVAALLDMPTLASESFEAWQSLSILVGALSEQLPPEAAGLKDWLTPSPQSDYPLIHQTHIRHLLRQMMHQKHVANKAAWQSELEQENGWVKSIEFDIDALIVDASLGLPGQNP